MTGPGKVSKKIRKLQGSSENKCMNSRHCSVTAQIASQLETPRLGVKAARRRSVIMHEPAYTYPSHFQLLHDSAAQSGG